MRSKEESWHDVFLYALEGYRISYEIHENGQFGDLHRLNFDKLNLSGNIDVWSKGWLDVDIFDLDSEKMVMNILLSPNERSFKDVASEIDNTLRKYEKS